MGHLICILVQQSPWSLVSGALSVSHIQSKVQIQRAMCLEPNRAFSKAVINYYVSVLH